MLSENHEPSCNVYPNNNTVYECPDFQTTSQANECTLLELVLPSPPHRPQSPPNSIPSIVVRLSEVNSRGAIP